MRLPYRNEQHGRPMSLRLRKLYVQPLPHLAHRGPGTHARCSHPSRYHRPRDLRCVPTQKWRHLLDRGHGLCQVLLQRPQHRRQLRVRLQLPEQREQVPVLPRHHHGVRQHHQAHRERARDTARDARLCSCIRARNNARGARLCPCTRRRSRHRSRHRTGRLPTPGHPPQHRRRLRLALFHRTDLDLRNLPVLAIVHGQQQCCQHQREPLYLFERH
mmetsp:Transcript_17301/g.37913  ORF Transcript_17301/g.37913 Transcript_17301/m.37913 type:complete len:216 (+) Transcript_17301:785-1432(+)